MTDRVVSDDVLEKAGRLLVEGHLDVIRRAQKQQPNEPKDAIWATCVGDSGESHRLKSVDGVATCSCPAKGVCSHLLALALVTGNPPRPQEGT